MALAWESSDLPIRQAVDRTLATQREGLPALASSGRIGKLARKFYKLRRVGPPSPIVRNRRLRLPRRKRVGYKLGKREVYGLRHCLGDRSSSAKSANCRRRSLWSVLQIAVRIGVPSARRPFRSPATALRCRGGATL